MTLRNLACWYLNNKALKGRYTSAQDAVLRMLMIGPNVQECDATMFN